jgi:hypothetical protein
MYCYLTFHFHGTPCCQVCYSDDTSEFTPIDVLCKNETGEQVLLFLTNFIFGTGAIGVQKKRLLQNKIPRGIFSGWRKTQIDTLHL